MPDISLAKMGLFGINRELWFWDCNHGEPPACSHMAKEGEYFDRAEKEVGVDRVNKESMASHQLVPCQERRGVFLLLGSAIVTGHESASFWPPSSI